MKCSNMWHFIWVFAVSKSTHLWVSQIQMAKYLIVSCYIVECLTWDRGSLVWVLSEAELDTLSSQHGTSSTQKMPRYDCKIIDWDTKPQG